ncbi:hypothetical protein NN561_008830 [Cricetulus griseus]
MYHKNQAPGQVGYVIKVTLYQMVIKGKRPLAPRAQGSERVRAALICRTAALPVVPDGSAISHAPLQPSSVQGLRERPSSSPGVPVGAPAAAAVAGSPRELQIEACWEHSPLLPGNVLCPAPQETPARRQRAASPSASPRPHRRRTRQTRGRQAPALRSELPGASQVKRQ